MGNNGGTGAFFIVLLLVIVTIGAGSLLNDHGHHVELEQEKQAEFSTLEEQYQAEAEKSKNSQQLLQSCRADLEAAQGAEQQLETLQLKNKELESKVETMQNQLGREPKCISNQVPNRENTQNLMVSEPDVNILQKIPGSRLILYTGMGLFGMVVFAAYRLIQEGDSRRGRKSAADSPTGGTETVYVKMTREEAREYIRNRRKK